MTNVPWIWLALRGTGLVAWALLTCTVVWGLLLRTRLVTVGSPLRMFEMHKWLGALGLGFLVVHLVTVFLDPSIHFSVVNILVPFTAAWRPVAIAFGIFALYFMIPVSIIGRIRQKLGKRGNMLFQKTHWLAYAAWPLATAHYLMAGTDALTEWSVVAISTATAAIVFCLMARGWRVRGPLVNRARS